MIFRDKYTDFSFNEVNSRKLKVWITNNLDIQFGLAPPFSDTFEETGRGYQNYYSGTKINNMTLPVVKCIAVDVTLNEWRTIANWLSPLKIGRLQFDFNKDTFYWAKLTSAPNGVVYVRNHDSVLGDRYYIEFSLSFMTVNDFAAIGQMNRAVLMQPNFSEQSDENPENMYDPSANSYYFPLLYAENHTQGLYRIYNTGAYQTYPNFQLTELGTGFSVKLNGKMLYQYSLLTPGTIDSVEIYGNTGIVMYHNRLLEEALDINGFPIVKSDTNRGPCAVESGRPELIEGIVVEYSDGVLKVKVRDTAYNERHGEPWSMMIFKDIKKSGVYDDSEYPVDYSIKSHINPVFIPDGEIAGFKREENYIIITIDTDLIEEGEDGLTTNISEYKKDDKCYISICNYSTLAIRSVDMDSEGVNGYVTMQTRGII